MALSNRAGSAAARPMSELAGSVGSHDFADPADAALAEQLFDVVGLLRRQARRLAGRPWPIEALSGSQVELVRLVRRRPMVSVAEAAAELGVAPNTVSTLVRHLTEAGLLWRTRDDRDRRVARLRLTPAAQRRAEEWRDRRATLVSAAIGELSAPGRAAIEDAIPVIAELAASLHDES